MRSHGQREERMLEQASGNGLLVPLKAYRIHVVATPKTLHFRMPYRRAQAGRLDAPCIGPTRSSSRQESLLVSFWNFELYEITSNWSLANNILEK